MENLRSILNRIAESNGRVPVGDGIVTADEAEWLARKQLALIDFNIYRSTPYLTLTAKGYQARAMANHPSNREAE